MTARPGLMLSMGCWWLVLAACNNPPDGPSEPPTFQILPQRQWSGGTILITSQEFPDPSSTIPVLFDSVVVLATRLDDSTVQVRSLSVQAKS